ncbi:MAG: MFS transporter [Candidatus Peribacteraceae bacterium]|nr:MFS transporter [Candidatus Peribacteraceae bacterium]
MRNRTRILLWALYDFANSLAFANVSFYFGLWFISQHGASDAWMSASVAVVTIMLLGFLPFLGRLSDGVRLRMPFLIACTLLTIITLLALGFFMHGVTTLTTGATVAVFVLYSFFHLFYMSNFAFYDAFIRDLSSRGTSPEKISAFGMGFGQLGNITGLIILLPIAQGTVSPLGFGGIPAVFIAAAVLFFLFSLPTLLFLRDSSRQQSIIPLTRTWGDALRIVRRVREYPGVLPFLLTYCLFADALLTLQLFTSFYLKTVGKLNDTQNTITVIIVIISGVVGSFASPFIVRFLGSTKRAITASIALWMVVLGAFAFAQEPRLMMGLIILNGFAFGTLFSLSRAFYATLVPENAQAEMFSIYSLFERTASIIGPLLWSATAVAFSSFGDDKYRFSVFSLALLIGVSLVIFQFVREPLRTR